MASAAAALLAGCSQKVLLEKFSSPEDRALGIRVIGDLEQGPSGDKDLDNLIDPKLRTQLHAVLPQMRAMMPPAGGAGPELVGAHLNVSANTDEGSRRDASLAWRVSGGGRKALVELVITRMNQQTRVTNLHVEPEGVSPSPSPPPADQTKA